jgi:hypothetical protein
MAGEKTPKSNDPESEGFVYEDEVDRLAESTYTEDHDVEYDDEEQVDIRGFEDDVETMYDPESEKLVSAIKNRYQGFYKDKAGEAHIVDMRKVSIKTRPKQKVDELLARPVVPAIITPDRRRPLKRDHRTIFAFGDAQIGYRRIDEEYVPLHDELAISAAVALARHLRPDVVVDLGDTTDFAELSRFQADANHFHAGTLQKSLQRTHDMYAEFTAVTPGAHRVIVDSNHTARLDKYLMKNAEVVHGLKAVNAKYPLLSYPGLLDLDNVKWDFVSGYEGAAYEYADDLAFIHGRYAVSNGSTAAKLSKDNHDRNIVQGHKHSIESHYYTDRKGNKFGAFVVGALCRIDGVVPSYHSSVQVSGQPNRRFENWQNGVMVIRDYGEGHYQFDQVPITNGVIHYNGKTFIGAEAER